MGGEDKDHGSILLMGGAGWVGRHVAACSRKALNSILNYWFVHFQS